MSRNESHPDNPQRWLAAFIELLLKCDALQTPAGRRMVVSLLPGDLPNSIGEQDAANKVAVTALALGCAGVEGGIAALREVLAGFDGSTTPFKAVAAFLEAHPTPLPSAFPQDEASREATIRNINIGTGIYNEGSIQATIKGGIGVVGSTVNGNITYNDYRQGGPARSPLVPPNPPEYFAGRERELKELADMLEQSEGGEVALTALRGQGGIGKTTLARQVAHQLYTAKVFGAVLWVEVKPKFDPWPVLRRWTAHCGVEINEANPDWQAIAAEVKAGLGQLITGRALVVFDDVWADGVAGVRQLKEALPPDVTVLTTSRDQRVGLALKARRVEVRMLPTGEAVALLQMYLDEGELPQAGLEELAERLKGHALALTLAAKRLNRETNPAIALPRHLCQYAQGLPTGSAIARLQVGEEFTSREDSLALALAYSYDTLKPPDRQARFRALGALAYDQPFDLQLLLGLWEVPAPAKETEDEPAEDTAREWAEELRDLSLLEAATETNLGEGWYIQHPILHAYAAALLHTNPEEETTTHNHYYDRVTAIARPFHELQDKPEKWDFLTPYLPHIHTAGDAFYTLLQAHPQEEATARRALAFAINVYWYLYRRQKVHKLEWLEMGLAAARTLCNRSAEGWFLGGLAHYYDKRGHKTEALEYYHQDLDICREQNNQENEATTLGNIGKIYSDLGEQLKALTYLEQALPLLRVTGDRAGEAATLNNIGRVYKDLGDNQKALTFLEKSLPLLRATSDRAGEAATLTNVGAVYNDLGDKQTALTCFEQALPVLKATGDQVSEAYTLNNIGAVYNDLGDKQTALTYFEQALPLQRATGDRVGEALTFTNIGVLYFELGDNQKALGYFKQALPVKKATGDRDGEAHILYNMGWVLWRMGQREEGLELVKQAQNLFEQVNSPVAQVSARLVDQMQEELHQNKKPRSL